MTVIGSKQYSEDLSGRANLKDVEFTNGIIEYKLYFTGDRTYPGIYFRVQNPGDYEQFYIRPHRIWYDDDAEEPALYITHLDHGLSSGGIILNSFTPGLSYFSDFSISMKK